MHVCICCYLGTFEGGRSLALSLNYTLPLFFLAVFFLFRSCPQCA